MRVATKSVSNIIAREAMQYLEKSGVSAKEVQQLTGITASEVDALHGRIQMPNILL